MASRHDVENAGIPDERAPLLAYDATRHDTNTLSDNDLAFVESKPRSRIWQYVLRITLVLLGILIIAIFVKGWVDADDVDVSSVKPRLCLLGADLTTQYSLISMAP